MKGLVYLISFSFVVISCIAKPKNKKMQTTAKFINYVQHNDTAEALGMLIPISKKEERVDKIESLLHLQNVSKGYRIADQSKWYSEYDTLDPFVKIERIVVPLLERNTSDVKGVIRLAFDYTERYHSSDSVAYFELEIN